MCILPIDIHRIYVYNSLTRSNKPHNKSAKHKEVTHMTTLTLLEKAVNRLIKKARIRNIYPKGKLDTELNAMVNLLKNMDFEIDFDWNDEVTKITKITLTFEGETVERIV